jgi:hypothetical protein
MNIMQREVTLMWRPHTSKKHRFQNKYH